MPFLGLFLVTIKYSPKKGILYTIMQTTLPYCLVKVKTWFLLPAQVLLQSKSNITCYYFYFLCIFILLLNAIEIRDKYRYQMDKSYNDQ